MPLDLRSQLLAALATGSALGCKAEPPARPAEPAVLAPSTNTSDSASAAATPEPPPSAAAAAAAPDPPPEETAGACRAPDKRESYCLPVGKGPPVQIVDPKFEFLANGCVKPDQVVNSCNGVSAVYSGPVKKAGKCCYTICQGQAAPCGRLLLDDDGAARLAPVVAGDAASELPRAARDGWLQDACLEHASVAAFSRFALELMAVGAPAALVADAHRAALDELEHASLCFELAASGSPGPLSLAGISLRGELAAVVRAAAEECCCGETFAALVAQRALDSATHPAARSALARIAVDEASHAALGFRFVAWAIHAHGEVARAAADEGFALGLARLATLRPVAPPGLEAYGRVSADTLSALATQAAASLIEPLRAELQRGPSKNASAAGSLEAQAVSSCSAPSATT